MGATTTTTTRTHSRRIGTVQQEQQPVQQPHKSLAFLSPQLLQQRQRQGQILQPSQQQQQQRQRQRLQKWIAATASSRTTTCVCTCTTRTHCSGSSRLYMSDNSGVAQQSSSSSSSSSSLQPPAICIDTVSCSHDGGTTWQLRNVSYMLPRGAKVALVGRNGTGKSTLLRILAEHVSLDKAQWSSSNGGVGIAESIKYTGKVTAPRDVRVAYVEQEPFMASDITVADALLGFRTSSSNSNSKQVQQSSSQMSVYAIVRQYSRAVERADEDPEAFTTASALMNSKLGCWQVWTKVEEIATKLRVQHLQHQYLHQLSGGERKRVALAAALVQEPDVLLLDEPTNFLSLAGVQWLSNLLTGSSSSSNTGNKLTILMVTHDRSFLEEVCNRILELDHGRLYEYIGTGNGNSLYADYLQGKADRLALQDAAVQSAKAKYRLELDWMRRQPQARQTKAQARIDAFYKLQQATKPRPRDAALSLDSVGQKRRLGGKILSLRHVNLKFGDNKIILKDFSYDFCKGDRICLAGANGVGKTTLIRVITGEQPPDSGTIEMGDTIVLGVYEQLGILQLAAASSASGGAAGSTKQSDSIDPNQTVLSFVLERVQASSSDGSVLSMAEAPNEARKLLQQFEFPRSRWNERVSILSGGERRRLQMLSVLSQKPNFLIMDEPSVDCDLDTLSALESYLQNNFDGVLMIVSHDRAFADKVADHLFIFEGNGEIKDFVGTLSEYASTLVELENDRIQQQQQAAALAAAGEFGGVGVSTNDSTIMEKKELYKEDKAKRNEQRNAIRRAKKEMEQLEKSMDKLKQKAKAVQDEMDSTSNSSAGWSVLADLTEQLQTLQGDIDEKELKWMELAEFVEMTELEAST